RGRGPLRAIPRYWGCPSFVSFARRPCSRDAPHPPRSVTQPLYIRGASLTRSPASRSRTGGQSHRRSEPLDWRVTNMSGQPHERGLRSPAFSVTAFGLYLVGLALVLMTIPNTLLAIFGIAPTQEPWIRIAGMLAGLIGLLYVRYAPHGDRPFFELTVQLRATV